MSQLDLSTSPSMADIGVSFQMQQEYHICAHESELQHALEELALYVLYVQPVYWETEKQTQKKEAQWSWSLSPSCGCQLTGFILDSSYKMEE